MDHDMYSTKCLPVSFRPLSKDSKNSSLALLVAESTPTRVAEAFCESRFQSLNEGVEAHRGKHWWSRPETPLVRSVCKKSPNPKAFKAQSWAKVDIPSPLEDPLGLETER